MFNGRINICPEYPVILALRRAQDRPGKEKNPEMTIIGLYLFRLSTYSRLFTLNDSTAPAT